MLVVIHRIWFGQSGFHREPMRTGWKLPFSDGYFTFCSIISFYWRFAQSDCKINKCSDRQRPTNQRTDETFITIRTYSWLEGGMLMTRRRKKRSRRDNTGFTLAPTIFNGTCNNRSIEKCKFKIISLSLSISPL